MLEFLLPAGLLAGEPLNWYAIIRPESFRPPPGADEPRAAPEGAEPRVLLFESFQEGLVFISRYAGDLAYITDTGYPNREDAVADCAEEFGEDLGQWTPIPDDVEDLERYVLGSLASAPS